MIFFRPTYFVHWFVCAEHPEITENVLQAKTFPLSGAFSP